MDRRADDQPDTSMVGTARSPSSQAKEKSAKSRVRMGFYVDSAVAARIRGAFVHTRGIEPDGTLGEFLLFSVLNEVSRLESLHNGGSAWPEVGAGQIKSITQLDGIGRHRGGRGSAELDGSDGDSADTLGNSG
jgi:hypothetical protein